MNKIAVAKELIKIAKALTAIEFPSEDARKKYLKEHPGADKSLHTVKKQQKQQKPKKETHEELSKKVDEAVEKMRKEKSPNVSQMSMKDMKRTVMDILEDNGDENPEKTIESWSTKDMENFINDASEA